MKAINFLFLITGLLIVQTGCNKADDAKTKTPGYFILTEVKNKGGESPQSIKSTFSGFDFGDLRSSREFFFLLVNGGEESVFNITLSTNHQNFKISPSYINELTGGIFIGSSGNTGMIPLITLGITHGRKLNGVGNDILLPPGMNTSVLTIRGKTLNYGDTIEISSSYDLSVNAMIMNIELFKNDIEIDLTKPDFNVSSSLGGLGWLRVYQVEQSSSISLKNTGNMPVTVYRHNGSSQQFLFTASPDELVSMELLPDLNTIIIDGGGTITHPDRIILGNDGKGYFTIWNL